MRQRTDIPWEKIYDYVLLCGREHDPHRFMVTVLEEFEDVVPYDQGLAFCLDENRKLSDQHFVRVKSRWPNMYIDYYSHLQDMKWSFRNEAKERFDLPYVMQIIWGEEPMSEFLANYIIARGVKCTLTFLLFDQKGLPRIAFSLDRTQQERYTDRELDITRYAVAQIANLYKNFYTDPNDTLGLSRQQTETNLDRVLTKRELEVVNLLARGLSPSHVAGTLHISLSTAYKHIAHIYKKLNVSSQQELLVRILGKR